MLSWVATNDAKNCMTKSGMAGRGFNPALVVLVVSGQATTHFFLFPYCKKSYLPGGQINARRTPRRGISYLFLS